MSSTTATVMTIEQEAAPRMSLSQRPKSDPAPFLRARDNEIDIELNTRPSHEQSSPAAQIPNSEAVSTEQVQTLWNPYKNRFRVLACCSYAFANGMNDSAPGALIASIERCVCSLLHFRDGLIPFESLSYNLWYGFYHFRMQCARLHRCCFLHQLPI